MNEVLNSAMRLLARREHGAKELSIKLTQKGFDAQKIEVALSECQRLGLQADLRFAEALSRHRLNQGYGPVKIRNELRAKQLDRDLIDEVLNQIDLDWMEQAEAVRKKKFKETEKLTMQAIQKQQRFLLYRGYPMDIVRRLFN